MKHSFGFSLIELLVVIAVLGILLSIGFVRFNPDQTAVVQAARIMSAQVTRARFEALKLNEPVGLQFNSSGSGSYVVFEDQDRDNVYDAGEELATASFGTGDFARTKLALASCGGATASSSATILFNGRGFYTAGARYSIQISNRSGSLSRYVNVSPQGRAEIVTDC